MLVYIFAACTFLIGSVSSAPLSVPSEEEINYELLGGGFEGDMILPEGFDPTQEDSARGVAIYGPRKWPNRVVPYDLSSISNAGDRTKIETAMRTITSATRNCVTFRPRTSSDNAYVKAQYGNGCSAAVGYGTGARSLTLAQSGCFGTGIIQHELLHSLGFYHEQSRPDRDSFVIVNHNNIQSGMEHNFNKYAWGNSVLNLNTAYDLGSIMHYGSTSFSKNGQPTISPRQSGVRIGQRDKLSATDIAEIRVFYGC